MELIEDAYAEMFEDATFSVDAILDNKLLPPKYRPKLSRILKDLRAMEADIIKDIGETNVT
jgi:hypothetical protein